MHINEQVSKRESEHMRGEWAHKREGGNSNSNRARAIASGTNNGGNNTITSSNGSIGDSKNSREGRQVYANQG